jgi:hypothetical protein
MRSWFEDVESCFSDVDHVDVEVQPNVAPPLDTCMRAFTVFA